MRSPARSALAERQRTRSIDGFSTWMAGVCRISCVGDEVSERYEVRVEGAGEGAGEITSK